MSYRACDTCKARLRFEGSDVVCTNCHTRSKAAAASARAGFSRRRSIPAIPWRDLFVMKKALEASEAAGVATEEGRSGGDGAGLPQANDTRFEPPVLAATPAQPSQEAVAVVQPSIAGGEGHTSSRDPRLGRFVNVGALLNRCLQQFGMDGSQVRAVAGLPSRAPAERLLEHEGGLDALYASVREEAERAVVNAG